MDVENPLPVAGAEKVELAAGADLDAPVASKPVSGEVVRGQGGGFADRALRFVQMAREAGMEAAVEKAQLSSIDEQSYEEAVDLGLVDDGADFVDLALSAEEHAVRLGLAVPASQEAAAAALDELKAAQTALQEEQEMLYAIVDQGESLLESEDLTPEQRATVEADLFDYELMIYENEAAQGTVEFESWYAKNAGWIAVVGDCYAFVMNSMSVLEMQADAQEQWRQTQEQIQADTIRMVERMRAERQQANIADDLRTGDSGKAQAVRQAAAAAGIMVAPMSGRDLMAMQASAVAFHRLIAQPSDANLKALSETLQAMGNTLQALEHAARAIAAAPKS